MANENNEPPELQSLEQDCRNILEANNGDNTSDDKLKRMIAMIGVNVVHLRRHSVTQQTCDWRHRRCINWSLLVASVIGVATVGTMIAQWISALY